jgi:hypothetical protein
MSAKENTWTDANRAEWSLSWTRLPVLSAETRRFLISRDKRAQLKCESNKAYYIIAYKVQTSRSCNGSCNVALFFEI